MPQKQIKKKKGNFWLYFGLMLGVILALVPFLFGLYTQRGQDAAKVSYERTTKNQDQTALLRKAQAYNRHIFQQQQTLGAADGTPLIKSIFPRAKQPIAYINIPAIHLDPMVVYYGSSDWVLTHGIGNLSWTSLPTGGKNTLSVLTGHSGLANQIYFDNIKHLHNGDKVFLHAFGKNMAYKVYKRKVIDPNNKAALKALHVQPGKDIIAMVTCTPVFINSHRLIVYAKRTPYKQAIKKHVTPRDFWSLDHIFLMIIVLFLLLLLIYLIYSRYRKQKRRTDEDK